MNTKENICIHCGEEIENRNICYSCFNDEIENYCICCGEVLDNSNDFICQDCLKEEKLRTEEENYEKI